MMLFGNFKFLKDFRLVLVFSYFFAPRASVNNARLRGESNIRLVHAGTYGSTFKQTIPNQLRPIHLLLGY